MTFKTPVPSAKTLYTVGFHAFPVARGGRGVDVSDATPGLVRQH